MAKRSNSYDRLLMPKSTRWKEEEINSHAMFLGCLLRAVRGLGFLMLTWIPAVLLGGFISNLGTVDFWALTVIALLQIIGVFRLFHELKYRDIGVFRGFVVCCGRDCALGCADCDITDDSRERMHNFLDRNCCLPLVFMVIMLIATVAAFFPVIAVGFGVILPGSILGILLVFAIVTVVRYGPVLVAIWSMLRLLVFRRLFFTSGSDGPGMFGTNASQLPNLTPAVDAAYCLGVAQGAVLLYWQFYYHDRKRIIKGVTSGLGFESESETETVRRYWHQTAAGCEKDLTFAAGRNLTTYAVELLESKSPDKFPAGIRILGTFIRQGLLLDEQLPEQQRCREKLLARLMLIKQLLTESASFCQLIEELLQMLGPKSPYGMEIRGHAARIVLLVAHEINLEDHTRCIECVSSLLDPIESNKQNPPYAYQRPWQLRDTPYERDWCLEWYERGWLVETCWQEPPESGDDGDDDSNCDLQAEGYMDMVWLGLSILDKLADDENNCSVMISIDGLLPRIMAPLSSNVLHLRGVDHEAWGRIVAASLSVMYRLAQAPGEAGKTLRCNISGKEDAIRTILERILQCPACPALEKAMDLLTLLCIDASLGMQETTRRLIQFMFNIFADGNCQENIRTLAGRKLALLSSQRADIILSLDGILDSLKHTFLSHPRSTIGIVAVQILDDLCEGNYTVDGECHKNMKNVMTAVMPQVLTELFRYDGSTEEATHTGTEEAITIAHEDEESRIPLQGNNQNASSPSQQNREAEQNDTIEWKKALLSLSVKFFDKYASDDDQNLPTLLNEVAPKLTDIADANIQPAADSLRIMKLVTKLAISLVRHGYLTEGMENLMTSLTTASNKMLNLDGLLLCSGVEGGANKTFITLCSLVEEAQKLVDSRNAQEGSVVQDSSPRNN